MEWNWKTHIAFSNVLDAQHIEYTRKAYMRTHIHCDRWNEPKWDFRDSEKEPHRIQFQFVNVFCFVLFYIPAVIWNLNSVR